DRNNPNLGSQAIGPIRSLIDYTKIGLYDSPSLQYTVRLSGKTISDLGTVANIYEDGYPNYGHSYIATSYRDGIDDMATAAQIGAWIKIIRASGVSVAAAVVIGNAK
ncbi:MAG: hypothetical protein AAF975_08355, partial [Spirochaetota bacterium]